MRTISTTDLAHRLRPVVTRLARRMRQVGAELSPDPGRRAGDDRLPRAADAVRARRARADPAARPPRACSLAWRKPASSPARPIPTIAARASSRSPPAGRALLAAVRDRKDLYLAQRLDRLSPEDLAALDRAAGILERMLEEDGE